MTNTYAFLQQLKSILPEDTWPWIIPALRMDSLIWNCLQAPEFLDQAVEQIGSDPQGWSPSALALLALNQDPYGQLASFDPELFEQARRTFEKFSQLDPQAAADRLTLADSGLLALVMAESWQRDDGWKNLLAYLESLPHTIWATPTACLFGFSDDRLGLIRTLVQFISSQKFHDLAIHAVLSNPLPLTEYAKTLHAALQDLPTSDCANLLARLKKYRPEFATQLARLFLEKQKTIPDRGDVDHFSHSLLQISQLLENAEIHAIGNLPSQTSALRSLALERIKELHVEVSMQVANASAELGDLDAARDYWKNAEEIEVESEPRRRGSPPADLFLALVKNGHFEDALALIDQHAPGENAFGDVLYQLASAHLLTSQRSIKPAQKQAALVMANLESQIEQPSRSQHWAVRADSESLLQLILITADLLLELSMTKEAIQAYDLALSIRPDAPYLLAAKASAQRKAGDAAGAAYSSHLAVGIQPHSVDLRRALIMSLEAAGDWESAYHERKTLLDESFSASSNGDWPPTADLHSLAVCALKAGHPQDSKEICHRVLAGDASDALAQATLGEAFAELGDFESAIDHLQKATQFSLHHSDPWLALARVRKMAGENAKAIETLRAASNAIPDDAAILYALAQAYLEENSLTQALARLRRAFELALLRPANPDDSGGDLRVKITTTLGQTLLKLGHLEEARDILESAYQAHPVYPGLAYAYARALLSLDQAQAALDPLLIAMQDAPEDPAPQVDYAQALLDTGSGPEEAVQVLNQAVQLSQDDPRMKATAQGLLAEALAASGDYNAALQAYYHALEARISEEPAWRSRLSFGLGKVALELGQPEIALANLQEAARLEPRNPLIQRKLSQAYTTTDLHAEALEAARAAKALAPEDVETLAWFAGQALQAGELSEALTALDRAIQIDSGRTDLLIQLAKIHAQSGQKQAALDVLNRILELRHFDPEDGFQAAQLMMQWGDPTSAAACLERVKKHASSPGIELLKALAQAYRQAGEIERSLATIDHALDLSPGNLDLYFLRVDLLDSRAHMNEAKLTLQRALERHPNNPGVHLRMAQVLRQEGFITRALKSAEAAIAAHDASLFDDQALSARALAAVLARARLQIDHARSLLTVEPAGTNDDGPGAEARPAPNVPDQGSEQTALSEPAHALPYYCLAAEMALEAGEEIAAAEALTRAFELAPEHPRVIALQARLALRRGDHATATQTLQIALEATGREQAPDAIETDWNVGGMSAGDILLAIGAAAVEFRQWDVALYLIRRAINACPHEAYSYLQLARTFVLRAEDQRLCDELDVVAHAPGQSAYAHAAFTSFEGAIQNASEYLKDESASEDDWDAHILRRWKARGMAIFQPSRSNLQNLEALTDFEPEDWAALIALLRRLGELGGIAQLYKRSQEGARPLPRHHLVAVQLALSLGCNGRRHNDLDESIQIARTALDHQPGQPLYHYLLATLAQRHEDLDLALRSVQTALSLWPNEPRWQAMAAQLYLSGDDATAAIVHMRNAAQLEPRHMDHYLALGEAYLKHGDVQQAVQTFERAHQIEPQNNKLHVALARAYLASSELSKAAAWAEKAIDYASHQIEPHLLRAKIALQANDARVALHQSQSALQLEPDHAEALYIKARALNLVGQLEEALSVLDQAIALAEDPLPLKLEQVELLGSSQGAEAAMAALQKLANQYPQEAAVLVPLANALAQAGRREEAITMAQQALRCENLEKEAHAQQLFTLGKLLRQSGQLDQALYQLNEALRLDPEDLDIYLELGSTYQDRREHAQALETYQQATEIAPRNPEPYYRAGILLRESHDYPGAEDMLRRAANLAHDDVNIHRQLGAIVALNLVHNRSSLPIDS
jgi:tetratricopeptide (TPR) repeat protein